MTDFELALVQSLEFSGTGYFHFPNACGGKWRDLAWWKNTKRIQHSGISHKGCCYCIRPTKLCPSLVEWPKSSDAQWWKVGEIRCLLGLTVTLDQTCETTTDTVAQGWTTIWNGGTTTWTEYPGRYTLTSMRYWSYFRGNKLLLKLPSYN